MDCSFPGSSVHGILQARIPEWVASPFSRGSALPGTEPGFPTLQPDSLLSEPPGKPYESLIVINQLDVMRYIASPLPAIFPTEILTRFSSVQFSCSVVSLCDPMNCSMPGLPVHHQLPEFTQTYIHQVSDAIQPSHPWSSPSPPAPNPSQHQSLFQ